MLWYKWWLDTRHWFVLGVMVIAAQAVALYMSYPMDPATTFPNGALGVSPAEMTLLRGPDFRSYVWIRWFSTTMVVFWPAAAVALAGTGFEAAAGREALLSLPLTRRRIALTRLALVLAQLTAIAVLPTLVMCAMAPLVGQRYPVGEALVQCVLVVGGGFVIVGITVFMRTVTSDPAAYVGVGALIVLWGLLTFAAKRQIPYDIFRLMNGADYFFTHRIPWTGLAGTVGAGAALLAISLRLVDRRDY